MFRAIRALPLMLALAFVPACGDDETPTTPTPTTPTVTENFSGSINPNGAATHTFTAGSAGSLSATLTAIGPDEATVMGLSLGVWNGTGCAIQIANDQAVMTTVMLGTAIAPGTLCVRVYDVGRFAGNTTYNVEVIHP